MRIFLDFDGTCVEHEYPKIGRPNFGCIEVIKKLQDAGHEIILNTYRVECSEAQLIDALTWFNNAYMFIKDRSQRETFELQPIAQFTKAKIQPWPWNLDEAILNGELYIDDYAQGIPLKPACMVPGNMVDWDELTNNLLNIKFINIITIY